MLPRTAEVRRLNTTCEVREVGGKKYFTGRAVVYNEWSELLFNSFRERIAPGAFDEHLKTNPDIIATFDHDQRKVLGRVSAGTLKLTPVVQGIDVEVEVADYDYSRNLAIAIGRGDIRGMSFIFDVLQDVWTRAGDSPCRTVTKANIFETSFVYFPAYEQTEAGMRGAPLAWPVEGEKRALESAARVLRPSLASRQRQLWLLSVQI